MKNMKLLLSLYWPTLFILTFSLNAKAQCTQPDITVSSDATWTNQTVDMTENRKIIITNGATLTMSGCTIRRKPGCPGYWDGIYLVTDEGDKAGLIATNGTRIEFSKKGIQAVNGFSEITLDDVEMSDNGQMIRAWDSWPFAPIGGGGFASEDHSRDGGIISPFGIPCSEEFPTPPKVTIRNHSLLKVFENGNLTNDPPKYQSQINILGGALDLIATEIDNETELPIVAVATSRGKCKIYDRTRIDGFWIGVYKGTDASANCVSEGLVMTYSLIRNTNLFEFFNMPGFSIYNISSDIMLKNNILESNLYSMGVSYGSIIGNNIYNGHDEDVENTSVYIQNPQESFNIFDNGLIETPLEFIGDNHRTYVTCNEWTDESVAVAAGGDNVFPMSWGTASKAAGNRWINVKPSMYNLSGVDDDIRYFYRNSVAAEIFYWEDGFTPISTIYANGSCTYFYPANSTELDDPDEYTIDIEELEEDYDDTEYLIESIIGHMDTTLLSVKEELAALKNHLNDLVGQGLLFHTTSDEEFWSDKIDPKVEELLGLNYLWYGTYMESIIDHLDSNPDPDAEALYDAANKMKDFFNNGKNLYNLTNLQVDTLVTFAESSYGNYTNILRNYLFMVYDTLIPYQLEDSGLGDLRSVVQKPIDQPVNISQDLKVSPNPFIDNISIKGFNSTHLGNTSYISIFNTEGKEVSSAIYDGDSGELNLGNLEPGVYVLKLRDSVTGKVESRQIIKGWK